MQRIIKFKAKRVGTDLWVYGSLLQLPLHSKSAFILPHENNSDWDYDIKIIPETICQLLNCGSGDFYENDKAIYKGKEYIVEFNLSYATLKRCSSIHGENETIFIDEDVAYLMKIIGNIHD